MNTVDLSADLAVELAETFRLLGEPNRLRLVCACVDDAVSVNDLAERLGLSHSLTSHHLRLLRAARLMRAQRKGKQVLYQAADDHVRRIVADMLEHLNEPDTDGFAPNHRGDH